MDDFICDSCIFWEIEYDNGVPCDAYCITYGLDEDGSTDFDLQCKHNPNLKSYYKKIEDK